MPAPALAAIPILVSFAEAAGIVVAGVATAAGIDTLSKKVEEYVEENPEQSQKILAMIMPTQGIASILKNESDDGEEVSEEEEVTESRPTKEIVLEGVQEGKEGKGNYSSPDARGNYSDTRGNIIRKLKEEGKISDKPNPNYDPDKPKFDWRSRQRKKADGGIMGSDKTYHQVRDQFMPMDSESMEYANGGGVGSMMKRKSFKGGGSDASKSDFGKTTTTSTSTNREKGIMSRGKGPKGTTGNINNTSSDNNNNNNNKPTISFSPVVQYHDNPVLSSILPTGVVGMDTNLGNSFKVRSMLDAVNTLKEGELIGDLEINAVLGDLGIRGYMDNEKNKNLDINYNDGTLSGQFNTDFENLNNLGIGFDNNGYTGNISTDFENTNARVGKTIDNPFGLKGNLTFGADTDFDKNKNIGLQYGMSFEDGGRVNYNQGSNWWDTLDPQGMNVYNSMKRGGHDDATIQSQLAMLGYYDPNAAPPDSTPDVPVASPRNIINQGGDGGGGGITASGPGLGYKGPGSTASGNFNIDDIGEGTIDDDDLSFGLSLKEGIFGLQRMLGKIPTPLNLALKAADKFKNYRADKKVEAAAAEAAAAEKQAALDAINASMARDQRINNQQDWTGSSDNYGGGMDSSTGNYNDPYDSGYAD